MSESVNHPAHYQSAKGLECIDVIEALALDFHEGNVLKYLWRASRKDPSTRETDLRKAQWYLARALGDTEEEEKPKRRRRRKPELYPCSACYREMPPEEESYCLECFLRASSLTQEEVSHGSA